MSDSEIASMRPGRLTPENGARINLITFRAKCFNEAGAINPGKLAISSWLFLNCCRFNEAGAINPGKLPPILDIDWESLLLQ